MEATKYAMVFAGLGLMISGVLLMLKAKRSSDKDATHIKIGTFEAKTKSAGSLVFVVGCFISLVGVMLPQETPAQREKSEKSAVNVNIHGDGSPGVGKMTGGSITVNVQKNVAQK